MGYIFYETFKYCPHVLKEPTLCLIIPLTLLFLVRSVKNISPVKNIIFASLSFVWLIHADERCFIYFPFFVLLFLLVRPFKTNQFLKSTGTWICCVLLLMLLWGIRNYKAFNQIVILTSLTTAITPRAWGKNLVETASNFSNEYTKQKLINRRRGIAIQFGNQYEITPREYGYLDARARALIYFWQPAYFKPTFI